MDKKDHNHHCKTDVFKKISLHHLVNTSNRYEINAQVWMLPQSDLIGTFSPRFSLIRMLSKGGDVIYNKEGTYLGTSIYDDVLRARRQSIVSKGR